VSFPGMEPKFLGLVLRYNCIDLLLRCWASSRATSNVKKSKTLDKMRKGHVQIKNVQKIKNIQA